MPGIYDSDGQPSIESLTGFEPVPQRAPGELAARVRAFMGEADGLPRQRPQDAPDTAWLRQELGL